jgi:hypothetical protein
VDIEQQPSFAQPDAKPSVLPSHMMRPAWGGRAHGGPGRLTAPNTSEVSPSKATHEAAHAAMADKSGDGPRLPRKSGESPAKYVNPVNTPNPDNVPSAERHESNVSEESLAADASNRIPK